MSWTAETNIRGPKGDKGDTGAQGPPGASGAGTGNVVGPASAVVDRIATYNGTSGTVIKDGGKLIADLALASHTHTASQVTDFSEAVDDRVGSLLVAGSNITLNYDDTANSLTINGSAGGGAASGITVTPAGNIAATNVQAALVELDNEKVAKAGDTMTGNLLVNAANPALVLQKTAAGQTNQFVGYTGTNARWQIQMGDSVAESGGNAGSNLVIARYTDAGAPIDAPLAIARSTGVVDFKSTPTVLGAPIGPTPATATPLAASGSGAVGTSVKYAREDHVHPAAASVVRSYLAGLILSTAGGSATFGIAVGIAADLTATVMMTLASAYTKTTGAWAVGSGVGALDTGAIAAAAWYHVFLIRRPDTSVVDVLISLSSTAPTLPANYTQFRRIGSMKTIASQWVKFVQDGDQFMWDAPVADVQQVNPGTAAVTRTLTTPLGLRVQAICVATGEGNSTVGTGAIYLSDLATADLTAGVTAGVATVMAYFGSNTTMDAVLGAYVAVMTNTASQIRSRVQVTSATTSLFIATRGWIDRRGRDD